MSMFAQFKRSARPATAIAEIDALTRSIAAGDLWAHTLVNEFARETFPGVGEVLTDKDAAEVALRHLIAEGYIGDATEGYDGNPDRTTLPDGDTSDDETAGIAFAAFEAMGVTAVITNDPRLFGTPRPVAVS